MPQTINATFRDEKDKKENRPIMLYETFFGVAEIQYLAEYDIDVTFDGHTYLKAPITHEILQINAFGEIGTVKIKVSNVNRSIWAYVMANDGFRGEQVTMRLVYADHLDDPAAKMEWIFWVDAPDYDESTQEATFVLTDKLDLYGVEIPARRYDRYWCKWTYKEEGCWILNPYTLLYEAPAGFTNTATDCDLTKRGPAG
jgi:lambda family phage minor tail protein L